MACASLSLQIARARLLAHASRPSSRSCRRYAAGGMAVEVAGRRELAEFVPDHVLGHQHRQELVAVVDAEGQADELRQDGRAARPDLDDLVAARPARLLRLLQQVAVDERTLPNRTCHVRSPLFRVAAADDVLVRPLVVACLVALGRRPHGVTG